MEDSVPWNIFVKYAVFAWIGGLLIGYGTAYLFGTMPYITYKPGLFGVPSYTISKMPHWLGLEGMLVMIIMGLGIAVAFRYAPAWVRESFGGDEEECGEE